MVLLVIASFFMGDAEREELIVKHMYLAGAIAQSYMSWEFTFDDARQSALQGMTEASYKFDPSKGVPFAAYARTSMHWNCKKEQAKALQRVIIKPAMRRKMFVFCATHRQLNEEAGRELFFHEVADKLDMSDTQRKNMWSAIHSAKINRYRHPKEIDWESNGESNYGGTRA